jgi:hypothetical protein
MAQKEYAIRYLHHWSTTAEGVYRRSPCKIQCRLGREPTTTYGRRRMGSKKPNSSTASNPGK